MTRARRRFVTGQRITAALLVAAATLTEGADASPDESSDPALVVRARVDEDLPRATVTVAIPVPASRRGTIELRALPLAGTRIVALTGSWRRSLTARAGAGDSGVAEVVRRESTATEGARAALWTVPVDPGDSDAVRQLLLEYEVEGATTVTDDRLLSVVPLVTPLDSVLAPRLEVEVEVPAGFSTYSTFPAGLIEARPSRSEPSSDLGVATLHRVQLPAAVSLLRVEARRGSAPFLTLERALDLTALVLLGAVIWSGVAHLRRAVREGAR